VISLVITAFEDAGRQSGGAPGDRIRYAPPFGVAFAAWDTDVAAGGAWIQRSAATNAKLARRLEEVLARTRGARIRRGLHNAGTDPGGSGGGNTAQRRAARPRFARSPISCWWNSPRSVLLSDDDTARVKAQAGGHHPPRRCSTTAAGSL